MKIKLTEWFLNLKTKTGISRDATVSLLVAILLVLLAPYITDLYEKLSVNWETEIVGKWDDKKARSLVLKILENHEWSEDEGSCSSKDCHSVIDQTFTIAKQTSDVKILVGVSDFNGICYACTSLVSIFEFQATNIGWELVVTDIGKISFGAMNYVINLEKDNIEFKEVAKNKLGIFINQYINLKGGKHAQEISAYVKFGNEYEKILESLTSCTNGGSSEPFTEISTNFEFIPTNIGLYQLKVESSGVIGAEPYSTSQIFSFNGNSYFPDVESFGCNALF